MADSTQRATEALISRLAASRAAVGNDLAGLRRRLDVPARVKDSIVSKPLAWFGGSIGAGFLTSLLLKRPRRSEAKKTRRSLRGLALTSLFALAKPGLQSWAIKALQSRFSHAPKDPGTQS